MKALLIFLVAVVFLIGFACSKESHKIVFKAKYIGKGCWDVIQILEPSDERFSESSWITKDSTYTGAVSVGELPEVYKSGQPFYLTIKTIVQDIPHPLHCSTPKYGMEVDSCSNIPLVAN